MILLLFVAIILAVFDIVFCISSLPTLTFIGHEFILIQNGSLFTLFLPVSLAERCLLVDLVGRRLQVNIFSLLHLSLSLNRSIYMYCLHLIIALKVPRMYSDCVDCRRSPLYYRKLTKINAVS